jgi:hypothetical protein
MGLVKRPFDKVGMGLVKRPFDKVGMGLVKRPFDKLGMGYSICIRRVCGKYRSLRGNPDLLIKPNPTLSKGLFTNPIPTLSNGRLTKQ